MISFLKFHFKSWSHFWIEKQIIEILSTHLWCTIVIGIACPNVRRDTCPFSSADFQLW
jgi:hypothetical protein